METDTMLSNIVCQHLTPAIGKVWTVNPRNPAEEQFKI